MPGRRKKSAFDRCVEDVAARGSAYDPYAVCAAAGVRKYGQREMTRRAVAGKRRAARASNPYESAAELSEAFHGRPAEEVEYIDTPVHEHGTLSKLGRLYLIELKDGITKIEFDADTMLSSNEAGTHLFIDGGDQSVDLRMFPECDPTKEACGLGKAKYITYETAKFHLGKRDKKVGPYRHKFGDESGDLPELVYDPVNRLLAFVGGHYYIDRDMPGGYSAGIRD